MNKDSRKGFPLVLSHRLSEDHVFYNKLTTGGGYRSRRCRLATTGWGCGLVGGWQVFRRRITCFRRIV